MYFQHLLTVRRIPHDVDEPNQDELIAENRDAALRDAESAADDISRRVEEGLFWAFKGPCLAEGCSAEVLGSMRLGADADGWMDDVGGWMDDVDGLEVEIGKGTLEKRGISTATTTGSALLCDTDDVTEAGTRPAMTWRSRGTTAPRKTCDR